MGHALWETLATWLTVLGAALGGNDDGGRPWLETWRVECLATDRPAAADGARLRLRYERLGERAGVTFHGADWIAFGPRYHSHEPWTFTIETGHPDDGGPPTLRLTTAQDRMRDTRGWATGPDGEPTPTGDVTRWHHLHRTWLRVDPDGRRRAHHWERAVGPTAGRTLAERKAAHETEDPWPTAPPDGAATFDCEPEPNPDRKDPT